MAGSKRNKFGLAIDSTSTRVHKKYLGDPNDPHFVPDSPLIDRQHLSDHEEAELKRLCSIALARVPHSDDTPGDAFKYLGPHVQRKSASHLTLRPALSQTATQPRPHKTTSHTKAKRHAPVPPPPQVPESVGSSNSSEVDRTDYSTPLTSAGITPGETNKRLSDALRRQSNSIGASSRHKLSLTKSRAASASQGRPPKSADAKEGSSTKKPSIALVDESLSSSSRFYSRSAAERAKLTRSSQFELDKQLPPIPPPRQEVARKPSINRLFKSIRRSKSTAALSQPASFPSADPIPPMPNISALKKAATHPAPKTGLADASPPPPPTELSEERKQRRFHRFSRFILRKESPTAVAVA
ncbi:hypothetical protein DV738_g893, partial [Chaetothyriales sp. CBS 135597]